MNYLNQNQQGTFKKFLLSTAIIGSVVCFSSGVLAMDPEDEKPGQRVTCPQRKKENKVKKDPVHNEDDRLELLGALRAVVSETCESIKKFDSLDDTRVMLLGTTGAGKSTLLHQLVGRPVYADYPEQGSALKLLVKEENLIAKAFAIGHTNISCTTHPNAYPDQTNRIIWWDCPGFLDTKGVIQEFSNQLAVSELFKGKKPSKILLVAEEAKFLTSKAQPIWEAVESIAKMFRNSKEKDSSEENEKILQHLKNNLVFIVTNASNDSNLKHHLSLANRDVPDMATEEKLEKKNKKIKELQEKLSKAPKDEGGALEHMSKALEIAFNILFPNERFNLLDS